MLWNIYAWVGVICIACGLAVATIELLYWAAPYLSIRFLEGLPGQLREGPTMGIILYFCVLIVGYSLILRGLAR